MAGPLNTPSSVRAIGTGFRTKANVPQLKWGTQQADAIPAPNVTDYTYTQEEFLGSIAGSQSLRAYFTETRGFKKVDDEMTEGGAFYESIVRPSMLTCDEGG